MNFQIKGYASSEVRFVEIQEKLCTDVERGETQCHDNHHHWEEHLEEWWKVIIFFTNKCVTNGCTI